MEIVVRLSDEKALFQWKTHFGSTVSGTSAWTIREGTRVIVLVSLVCHNKMPQTEWLKQQKLLFLMVLEAGKSSIMVPANSVSGEGSLPGL